MSLEQGFISHFLLALPMVTVVGFAINPPSLVRSFAVVSFTAEMAAVLGLAEEPDKHTIE